MPYGLGDVRCVSTGIALFKKPGFHPFKLCLRAEFSRHAPTQNVGFRQIQAGKMVGHFNDVFLIDHNAKGFFEQLFHARVDVGDAFRMSESFDKGPHHSGTRDPRTNDGTGGHNI